MTRHIAMLYAALAWSSQVWAQVAVDKYQASTPSDLVQKVTQARDARLANNNDAAIRQLLPIVEQSPNYFSAHYNIGLAYAEKKDFVNATKHLESAIRIRDAEKLNDATIFNSTGWVYMLAGSITTSESKFKDAEKNISQLNDASRRRLYDNMGWLYMSSGDLAQAEKYFRKSSTEFDSRFAKQNLLTIEAVRASAEVRGQAAQQAGK